MQLVMNRWYALFSSAELPPGRTWAGKRLAERVAGKDAGQAVFNLPIYNSPLEYPNLFNVVRSQAFAPFRRFGQYFLYKWYWMQDEL